MAQITERAGLDWKASCWNFLGASQMILVRDCNDPRLTAAHKPCSGSGRGWQKQRWLWTHTDHRCFRKVKEMIGLSAFPPKSSNSNLKCTVRLSHAFSVIWVSLASPIYRSWGVWILQALSKFAANYLRGRPGAPWAKYAFKYKNHHLRESRRTQSTEKRS